MRFLIPAFLLLSACGHKGSAPSETCALYPSAYMIVYPDHQLRKSDVSICPEFYRAKSVDGSAQIEQEALLVQLIDKNGQPYLTEFEGQ